MSDHENASEMVQAEALNPTTAEADQQTLTLDGRVYPMEALPADAVAVLNDLIRCENELNEHRFRMRQLASAQQSMTVTLTQLIAAAGLEPIATVDGAPVDAVQSVGEAA
ncbi:hypothetical protein CWE17_07225 [Synechococcus sp. BS56D]|uniref:DUF6447 family protein n=1 Tax=Synechococcus sp. BS56D TaxID=2055944 RepID=UPI00103A3E92|nr:DUF6447 family protein [Synechococcus sp. BS56D]TCD57627.1 hypothetical protein CWE17_07225 [Synechococcus sp. BS56D]